MQQHNWYFAYASVVGNSHVLENIPCQDFCKVEIFDTYCIAVVCDGAGSCTNSHLGAQQVTAFCIYHFSTLMKNKKWDTINGKPTQEDWHKEAKRTLYLIKEDLEKYSMNHDLELKSLSCTVIVTIALQDGLLVTHIGDGRAGYCNMNNEWLPTITPLHGELANQTAFITSDIWDDELIDNYIESNVINNDFKAFCLLSDGCEKATFECNLFNPETETYFDPNKPYSLFFDPNVKILPTLYKQAKTQEEINSLWETFLTNGNDKLKNEPDDKTLILCVKNIENDSSYNT